MVRPGNLDEDDEMAELAMIAAQAIEALQWRCDACKEWKPHRDVQVVRHDVGAPFLPPGQVIRNVKYCTDPQCVDKAHNPTYWQLFKKED